MLQLAESIGIRSLNAPLSRMTLIRDAYRLLVNGGRSYAAFTDREYTLVRSFRGNETILDPMSGYGLLTQYCAQLGLSSYCIEYNLPQYLWQLLTLPAHSKGFLDSIAFLESCRDEWPIAPSHAVASDEWLPDESRPILLSLLEMACRAVEKAFSGATNTESLAMALLLPFAGRLMCCVTGDVATRAKQGGLCVLKDWDVDFALYLTAINERLTSIISAAKCTEHKVVHGDARTAHLPDRYFSAMVTSPPYPNYRDYETMFAAENNLLEWLFQEGYQGFSHLPGTIIGMSLVSKLESSNPKSSTACDFIEVVSALKRTKQAQYDDAVYYLPYLRSYFAGLEEAYENVSTSLAHRFDGYITVVNNTHRGLVIPVAETIIDIWHALGFEANIHSEFESFHVGTKNPRARGIRARHVEYIVRVWR